MNSIITRFVRSFGMLFLLHACLASNAWSAACVNHTSTGTPYFIAKLAGAEFDEFHPGDYSVGQDIQTKKGYPSFFNARDDTPTSTCSSVHILAAGVTHQVSDYTYTTSIPGVGVKVYIKGYGYIPLKKGPEFNQSFNRLEWRTSSLEVDITLVKIGDIKESGYLTGTYMRYYEKDSNATTAEFMFDPPLQVKLRVPTCSVATSSIHVPMGTVRASELNGTNSVSARQKDFDIQLQCAGGDPGTSVRAYVTLTDDILSSNRGDVLATQQTGLPNGAQAATGVGIQVLRNGTPVRFGPASSAQGNMNQWLAGTIPQGQRTFSIPLQARYIQTRDRITPGEVRARATFHELSLAPAPASLVRPGQREPGGRHLDASAGAPADRCI